MRLKFLRVAQIVFLLFVLNSCSNESPDIPKPPVPDSSPTGSDDEVEPFFNIQSSNFTIESEEQKITINVRSNTSWELSINSVWIKSNVNQGNEDAEVELTIDSNPEGAARTGIIRFEALGQTFTVSITQNGIPLELIDYSGFSGTLNMVEQKLFLQYNFPVQLISINGATHNYQAGSDDVEYFDDNKGILFQPNQFRVGSENTYYVMVEDEGGRRLSSQVHFKYFKQKTIIPGEIRKAFLKDGIFWVLAVKKWNGEPSSSIFKFKMVNNELIEELRFEVGLDFSNLGYTGGDFFINPYNQLIYVTDPREQEIEVYNQSGTLQYKLTVPTSPNDPEIYPYNTPGYIAFTNSGKGILSVGSPGVSGSKWRFIDSTNDDLITDPGPTHPYYFENLYKFYPSRDGSKLYMIENRSTEVQIFNGSESFEALKLWEIFTNPNADATWIIPNKINNNLFVNGLWNQQILNPDLSYISKRSFARGILGDFCYDPNLENHIYGMVGDYFELLDYDNQETLFTLEWDYAFSDSNGRNLYSSVNNDFLLVYSDYVDSSTSRSQIMVLDTEMFRINNASRKKW